MTTEPKPKLVNLLLSPELLARIDDYRYDQRIPSRMEAIRMLVERSLPAAKKQKKIA